MRSRAAFVYSSAGERGVGGAEGVGGEEEVEGAVPGPDGLSSTMATTTAAASDPRESSGWPQRRTVVTRRA
jgi:hypothetical protein